MSGGADRKLGIIGWEITNACNLTCPHCFTAAARRAYGELSTQECLRLIDDMAELGVNTIGWTGGEPLLRNDLEELIAYARTKRIKSTITTNGVLLDRDRAARLIEAGNRTIQISIDGSTAERNRRMRSTSDEEYARTVESIRICKELNCRVTLATMIGRENLDDGPAMIALARREKVDTIRFCGYAPVGRGKRSDIKGRFEYSQGLAELLSFVQQAQSEPDVVVDFDIGFGPTPPDYGFHQCTAGIETFYLKATGDLFPCTSLTDARFLVGNVRQKSLKELWDSEAMRSAAAYPIEKIEGHCQTCENLSSCRGGCRGVVLAHTGDLDASFPLCLYRTACFATS